MVTVDRLRQISPAFRELSDSERQAITDFTFLWSLFEAKALNRHGSARAIAASAAQWDKNGQLTSETFRDELAYFRARYVDDGLFTYHFENLHLRANDMSDLVKKVLTGEDTSPSGIAAAVLIIVYRFRNNLFHGVKWSYQLQGQLENFMHANSVLLSAIELHEDATPGRCA